MSTMRFMLIAAGLFAAAFVGVSWAGRGFPVMAIRSQPLKADARIPTFEESVRQGQRKDWENSRTAQSDGDKERDKLRLALWQAAIGFNLSPCDPTMKKNLVEAMTRYVSAWAEMAGCKYDWCSGDDRRVEAAAAAFKTPADVRVHEALREALDKGGVGLDDFPRTIRSHVFLFTGMPFPDENTCGGGRRAERGRR